jgi:hypothetical protein
MNGHSSARKHVASPSRWQQCKLINASNDSRANHSCAKFACSLDFDMLVVRAGLNVNRLFSREAKSELEGECVPGTQSTTASQ